MGSPVEIGGAQRTHLVRRWGAEQNHHPKGKFDRVTLSVMIVICTLMSQYEP